MDRPRRKIISRCLEYNNGMLPEEEVALRQALRASLVASKITDNEEDAKPTSKIKKSDNDSCVSSSLGSNKKRKTKSNAESAEKGENSQRNKRKSDESIDSSDKKRPKTLLMTIKPRSRKEKSGSKNASQEIVKKKIVKSKTFKEKKTMTDENEVKVVKRRRRRKKIVDNMKHDENVQTTESLPKVHVQRKFAQSYPASPKSLMQYQSQMQPMKTRAKTEDFLDFLCLRGSSHMPKTLEVFNSPCAPVSPLTDEDESNKTTPSKTSTTAERNDNEPDAQQSLNMFSEGQSSSSSSSLVSSPVSTRVQFHTVLPQFTNNHGVLTHIPTPIPYPKPPVHAQQPGLDVYGALSATSVTPPLVPNHPLVTSVVMGTHMPPSASTGEKQGFHLVCQSGSGSSHTTTALSSPQKVGETDAGAKKSPKQSPSKRQDKVQAKSPKESPKKGPSKKNTSPRKSLNSGVEVKKETSKKSKNIKTDLPGSVSDDGVNSQKTVPVFSPTEVEFKNPLKYIESIRAKAEPFGICVIVPPKTWQPEYCLSDEIRFTTKLQRIHCLGKNFPSVEHELAVIRKHLGQQSILLSTMPQIAGCEIDLPLMSKIVEEFGGLQQIIDKRKWAKIADRLCIPKTAVDITTKLEHIYYKYLLSYDLLSKEEKTKLRNDILEEHDKKSGSLKKSSNEYITKGRSMSLAIFQRNAKNINEFYMKQANVKDIEQVFWQMIDDGQHYVVVHAAEVDSTAFPTSKIKPFYKSKWNLNVLPKTPGSLARDLPDVEGITSPMVKVEMVLSAEMWQKPPHDFYTMEYLHQGADKIWYSVPSCSKDGFLEVIKAELNGEIDDMRDYAIHHSSLTKSGIPLFKVVQETGQFIVKFPGAYHSSLSTGFCVSEFVSFASMSYLPQIKTTFQGNLNSVVDHMFSWESLIVSSVKDELRRNSGGDTLSILIPELKELRDLEIKLRHELATCGVVEKSESNELPDKKSRGRRVDSDEIENCNECNRFCFPSAIMDQSDTPLCLHHGLEKLKDDKSSTFNLTSHLSLADINDLIKEAEEKLEQIRSTPKVRKRQAGGGTENEGNKIEK